MLLIPRPFAPFTHITHPAHSCSPLPGFFSIWPTFPSVASCLIETAVSNEGRSRQKGGEGERGQTNKTQSSLEDALWFPYEWQHHVILSFFKGLWGKLNQWFPPETPLSSMTVGFISSNIIKSNPERQRFLHLLEIQLSDEWSTGQNWAFRVRKRNEKMHVYTLASPLCCVYFHLLSRNSVCV